MITVIQFLAPKSHCRTFWLIGSIGLNKITNATKLQSLDYQEANVEWERWAVSDSDSSEEEQ